MINVLKSLVLATPALGVVYFLFRPDEGQALAMLSIITLLVNSGIGFYLGLLENIKAMIWAMITGYGVFWSAREMISSVDFDAPFLMSFYWSTVGFFFLTCVLLIVTGYCLYSAASDPEET